jgi:perosamine synthetase
MNVDNIPWWEPQISKNEFELVHEVLKSNYINEGEVTEHFERTVADLLDVNYAVATSSGTASLFLALAAHGITFGDEVIIPDVTFIATANAVTLTGATPVLVDIDPATLNISPDAVRNAITPRTRAILPVHVSGRSANMPDLLSIAKDIDIPIIEDAAEAFMSKNNYGYLGAQGSIGCFSFSPNKIVTTGQGGIAITNDERLYVRLRQLKDQGRITRGTGGADIHSSIGYNFKLTNLQAAVGLGQLTQLQHRLHRQRSIYAIYAKRLADCPNIKLPGFDLDVGELPLWTDAIVTNRDDMETHLQQQGINCRRFWLPIHNQIPYHTGHERFPNSTELMSKALWLPSAFTLTDADIHRVCDVVELYCKSTVSKHI